MNDASASPPLDAPQNSGGLQQKFLLLIALAIAAHLALIFVFGAKKQIATRPPVNVPQLQFANNADELMELDNPVLFALPNARDFSSAIWQKAPAITQPQFRYHENPRWLPLTTENLGTTFSQFMQTNEFGRFVLDFKPAPLFTAPAVDLTADLPQNSTLQISGALTRRNLISSPALPSLPLNDIIAPSKVQLLVDQVGNVVSVVLLPPENSIEAAGRAAIADTNAVALALKLKFSPAPELTTGQAIFRWYTIPVTATNPP
jgi:hypothetical protein